MKTKYLVFIFSYTLLNANSNQYEVELYNKVLPSIFTKKPITVFVDKETKALLKESKKFKIVNKCDAKVVLLIGKNFTNLSTLCRHKPQFSTSYKSFKNDINSFGAFYWRKGRPQIRFQQEVIDRYNLRLPDSLQKYIK